MTIRAKFVCEAVTKRETSDGAINDEVKLRAVYATEGDNAEWSKWTPSGELSMTITNPACAGAFEPGKSYYLDISEAE